MQLKADQKPTRSRPEADQKKHEETIIELIKGNPYITRKEIAQQLNIHDSSVKLRLDSLQERNIVKRVGAAKGGYWNIIYCCPIKQRISYKYSSKRL